MCGIAGIIGTDRDYVVDSTEIHRMCQKIIHRGPDDEGLFVSGRVGLGMRRLSIIDLSTGRQPIYNEDRSICIVFNGEIYNFLELRPGLEHSGHTFSTNTDTEVIVHLYEEYGSACVEKLRGMFAFALWDDRQQRLLLARDRLGKKPLHYAFSSGRFLFGSEIKSLLEVAPELAELNTPGLLDYFYFGYVQETRSVFTQIQKLAPAHLLEYADGKVTVRKYWDLPAYGTHSPRSEEECLDELEGNLSEAVRMRLISDVPLGALLSGGVDSSVVVALMARASSRPVKTFSIAFPNEDFNESNHAQLVSRHFRTEHHELVVDADFGETLYKLTHMMEEPFADDSMLPTYCVCALTRRHVTVALAGDGGDEFFAGYDRYQVDLRRKAFPDIPPWVGRFFRNGVYPRLPAAMYGRRFLFNVSLPSCERYLDSISYLRVDGRDEGLFSRDFLGASDKFPSPLDAFRDYLDAAHAADRLSRIQHLDVMTYLPSDILTKVDRMSMAASLEVRAPLLDHVLVEWATRLSPQWKRRAGQSKYILKKLAERLGVPRQVLYRPKQGFAVPLVHWFRDKLKRDLLQILLEPKTLQRGFFNVASIRGLMDEHLRGRRDRSSELWLLLIFELWHRNFLESLKPAVVSPGFSIRPPTEPGPAAHGISSCSGVE
jgi:asparagine synthase (glutamine-hydrolysing)